MTRFNVTVTVNLEVEAEDKAAAFEAVAEWVDAVQDGDGVWMEQVAASDVIRCRMLVGNCAFMYDLPVSQVLSAGDVSRSALSKPKHLQ